MRVKKIARCCKLCTIENPLLNLKNGTWKSQLHRTCKLLADASRNIRTSERDFQLHRNTTFP